MNLLLFRLLLLPLSYSFIKRNHFFFKNHPKKNVLYLDMPSVRNMMATQPVVGFEENMYLSIGHAEFGLGLYINVLDCVDQVCLPKGTMLCEYFGEFKTEAVSDKAVGFGFFEENDIHSWIYFNGRLQHLWEAIYEISPNVNEVKLRYILEGHEIYTENNVIQIKRNILYNKTRFVPFPEVNNSKPQNFASYANDMAYEVGVTDCQQKYTENYHKNILMLVWKLEKDSRGLLVPKNPVLVTKTLISFTNKAPMEIGVGYGWDYWLARINF